MFMTILLGKCKRRMLSWRSRDALIAEFEVIQQEYTQEPVAESRFSLSSV